MSLIDKEVSDFKVKAYHNEEIIDVELKDVKGKWSIFWRSHPTVWKIVDLGQSSYLPDI